jgi:AraC-like DNA-binding protein
MKSAARSPVQVRRLAGLDGTEVLYGDFSGVRLGRHSHDTYSIGYVKAGVNLFDQENPKGVAAPRGSVCLANPGEVHTGAAGPEGWWYVSLAPTVAAVAAALDRPVEAARFIGLRAPLLDHDEARAAVRSMAAVLTDPDAGAMARDLAVIETLRHLFKAAGGVTVTDSPVHRMGERRAVRRACEILATDLAQPLSLTSVATAVGLSPYHFARVFKAATGLPPHAWRTQRRLEMVRSRIRQGVGPGGLADVAAEAGFADQAHLTRVFKRAYGVSPGRMVGV